MVLAAHPNPTSPVLSHFSLKGKTALVTGASRGIGLQVATGFLEAGASVAITYWSTPPDEISSLVTTLSSSNPGSVVKAYQLNVTDRAAVSAVIQAAAKELGGLDIVVANAGIADHIPAEDYPEDKFRDILDVNFNGAFWTAQAAANLMNGSKTRGSIIFTASVSAILVNVPQTQAAYNASKAAVVHLAKSLAVEWTSFARVNCVSPGFIATDMLEVHPKEWRDRWFTMIPGARLCEPAELKGSYVFLASDASSYMTGSNLVIDGGYTLP
ncbi:hypothetical protein QQX98_010473 [Neonectria punicea]|uniref:Uncharacterized protein n=1 Tax=Neonectria punicea TaxID=979145 RepID=A0ABR1GPA6_9HYPO